MQNDKNVVGWVVTVIVLAALGLGIYYLLDLGNKTNAPTTNQGSTYSVSTIQVKHQYKAGSHVYVGTLDLPTPCYALDSSIAQRGDTNTAVITLNTTTSEETCAQVVTSKNFRVEIVGPADMKVEGVLNGRPVELNIFEVPADQNIDLVEINVKG